MTHPFFSDSLMIMAHRGDSSHFPENTLQAFTAAAEAGADCIETDIHLTKDGSMVIFHDETAERLGGGSIPIASCTLSELQELDAGCIFSPDGGESFPFLGKGIRVITIEEALQALPDMKFNVDLKAKDPALVHAFADCLVKHQALDRVLCASFHDANLRILRHLLPDAATSCSRGEAAHLFMLARAGLLFLKQSIPALAVQIPPNIGVLKVVSPKLIRRYQQAGLYVHVWTINDRETMKQLTQWGVDGIFTDKPAVLAELLGR